MSAGSGRLGPIGHKSSFPLTTFRVSQASGGHRLQRILRRFAHNASPTVRLRLLVRRTESWLALLAVGVGVISGLTVAFIGWSARQIQSALFNLSPDQYLSSLKQLQHPMMWFIPLGGALVLAISGTWIKTRGRRMVDPVEANALYGGRLSFTDSIVITVLTVVSNGFGASVGLEAAYVQMAGAYGSKIGRYLKARRSDVRLLLGCGAAAAIAAAFNAPLAGSFYAFELIIGTYSISAVAPVVLAAIAGAWVAKVIGISGSRIQIEHLPSFNIDIVATVLIFAVASAAFAILLMLMVAAVERFLTYLKVSSSIRPIFGGLALVPIAAFAPFALSAGHGAFHDIIAAPITSLNVLLIMIAVKSLASAISLGCGYRGGLFFASLLIGTLLGQACGLTILNVGIGAVIELHVAGLLGMTGLAAAVVGGPITMAFLALELSGSFTLTVLVLATAVLSSLIVRETFGYSFTTWRFHLRGESIRGAHDMSYIRNLTVGRMMRKDVVTVSLPNSIRELQRNFPLGSSKQIIISEQNGGYAGIVNLAELHFVEEEHLDASVKMLLQQQDIYLNATMSARQAAAYFERHSCDFLVVVDPIGAKPVIGSLAESFLLRRYAEEMDKMQTDMHGKERSRQRPVRKQASIF